MPDSIPIGIALSIACECAAYLALRLLNAVSLGLGWTLFFWGIAQWIFVVPLMVALNRRHKPRTVKGLLIASLAMTVLNLGFVALGAWVMKTITY